MASSSNAGSTQHIVVASPELSSDDVTKLKLPCGLYVVSNPNSSFRRANMERRVKVMDIADQTTFIEGGDYNSGLVSHYLGAGPEHCRGAMGCLIGHLRACNAIVNSGESHGCIVEDDVLFRDDFVERLNEFVGQHADRTIIQLFCISKPYYGPCNFGYYGTQGYVIRSDYAKEMLQKYDRPVRYWPEGRFKTSEVITMYSGGICRTVNPIIIEDGLSQTLHGDNDPGLRSNKIPHRIYSYNFGLYRYINCDPEFQIEAADLDRMWNGITSWPTAHIKRILDRTSEPKTQEEELAVCVLHMLCDWHHDRPKAREWADRFFRLISAGELSNIIAKRRRMICETARFYEPRYPTKVGVALVPDLIDWDHPMNWIKIPRAPYILVGSSSS